MRSALSFQSPALPAPALETPGGFPRVATRPENGVMTTAEDAGRLYERYASRVARWVGRLGGPGLETDDLVQEVFLIAHRRLHTYQADAKVETWLYGIAENVVRHRRRRERVRRVLLGLVGLTPPVGGQRTTPDDELEAHRAAAFAYELIDGMSEKLRSVLVLYDIEGLSWAEIEALTGERPATLRVRLHRARELFMREFRKRARDGEVPPLAGARAALPSGDER
jgi:RNA polymerase sigma-70 factor (ECF subfamily)